MPTELVKYSVAVLVNKSCDQIAFATIYLPPVLGETTQYLLGCLGLNGRAILVHKLGFNFHSDRLKRSRRDSVREVIH